MVQKIDKSVDDSKPLGQRHTYDADHRDCVSTTAMKIGFSFEEISNLKRLYQDVPLSKKAMADGSNSDIMECSK